MGTGYSLDIGTQWRSSPHLVCSSARQLVATLHWALTGYIGTRDWVNVAAVAFLTKTNIATQKQEGSTR